MKKNKLIYFLCFALSGFILLSCSKDSDEPDPIPEPVSFTRAGFVTGLNHPIGGSVDARGNLWVTDAGTGADDASVIMITATGEKTTLLSGLPSVVSNGSIEGISHALAHNNKLYILHGISGMLYIADVSGFTKESSPLVLEDVPSEDVKTFINAQNLVDPLNSNAYDLTIGPDGDLFFTDAGSNAIIRRKDDGTLSVFAKIPALDGGADAVPTGIAWDGNDFYVSILTGFPFAPEAAKIIKVDKSGTVSDYKTGFSTLSAINFTAGGKPLVVQLGVFGATGFGPTEGKVLDETGKVLAEGFGMPTDLIKNNDRSYYLVNYLSGDIDLLSY